MKSALRPTSIADLNALREFLQRAFNAVEASDGLLSQREGETGAINSGRRET